MEELRKSFKGRDFLSLRDFTGREINFILDEAARLKAMQKAGIPHPYLQGKTLAMIFQKSSTRTRVSFEVAMLHLGGHALFLSPRDIQMGRGESVPDTARVLSRYVDGIMIRTFSQSEVEELAEYATVPVINGLTDLTHPGQILADLLTVKEHKGQLAGLKLAYIGDGNNIAHSLLLGCPKVGMHISVASPEGYRPNPDIVTLAKQAAEETGVKVEVISNPVQAITDADVVVTDVWASMGQEQEQKEREQAFAGYQVNQALCAHAKPDYIFLHCLPAHRGEEVTADIIDGPHSAAWDEAENRLHIHKALLALLL
ncbi:Ornithine carbamoyltransferase [Desulfotomaculum nigrificans CO-1-SRB]|uniref:Ornithine carbamoyltransferase n=1 Tax=Desulfotomaculum nigrificans (strain DSM 14880 / VKM B-2319 / CO-1-SRB) TaxID=868595 RepID=F6B5U1_DESCC|nr:ornithine carbamoyltransferase [Desulfotomaculum nigrificans]AEF93164.1 Ornithine carbamoyltransferase [Desulfotomaculum nigrificans CO-1-SRB]